MKKCYKCDTILEDDELFCHECGAKQEIEEVEVKPEEQSVEEKLCVHCGKAIEPDSLFCPYCGKPQEEEETKSGEPQPKAEETEPDLEKPQKEKPNVKEELKAEESPKEEPMAEEDPVYEMEEKKKSKTWIWILLGVILLGIIGAGYYFLTQTDDTPKTEENDVVIATSLDETTLPSDPKEFLNSLYNDFYEQGNSDRFDEAVLSKYFTKGAMRKFYVEDSYEDGHYFYCTDFLTHGTISGGPDPDYGDKIVYRLIVTENDGWFKVTNIWDVIKEPVIVHLQVKTIDGALKIVDVKAKNLDESEAEETAQERISFEDVLVVVKEMIIEKNGSFVGFQSPEKVENIMAKYGYKKRKRYFVYRALNLEPLYYKNCSFEETTEDDYEYSEVPSAGKGGTPSFVGIDASNVVVELFTKDALDDFLNQMKESGASLKEENKDQNFSHYELDPYEITVYTSLAWGFHYCIFISKKGL